MNRQKSKRKDTVKREKRQKIVVAFLYKTKMYLANRYQKAIQMSLELTRNGNERVKKSWHWTTHFLYHHSQQIFFFVALLLFLELRLKRHKIFLAFLYKTKMYLADRYQRASEMSLELTRNGIEQVKIFWHWTTHFLYHHNQQILFFVALLLFLELREKRHKIFVAFLYKTKVNLSDRYQRVTEMSLELLRKLMQNVKNFWVTSANILTKDPLKCISSILLPVLIVIMVIMNYQLYIERNQLLEERKLLLAEKKQLIAEREKLMNQLITEWQQLRRREEDASGRGDGGFIYFLKKAGNILELAAPFTKLFW